MFNMFGVAQADLLDLYFETVILCIIHRCCLCLRSWQ